MAPHAGLLAADEALRLILGATDALGCEEVAVEDACGRVAAEAVAAREDLPAFDHSAMDGYAVRARGAPGESPGVPRVLALVAGARAGGGRGAPVGPGEAARILTGAPIPDGADAVVMQELTAPAAEGRLLVLKEPRAGLHIRRRGEDLRAGDLLLAAGRVLRPVEVGLLSAQGIAAVRVVRRARVSILTTGDEFARPAAGAVSRDANGPALAAACRRWGARERRLPPVGDDRAALAAALSAAAPEADLLLVTGGASVGDFDFTRRALEDAGARIVFAGAAIKPGAPLLFALLGGRPVFGLPGNPVAALVCAEEFARPALERLHGLPSSRRSLHVEGVADGDYPLRDARRHYLFCRARLQDGRWRLEILRPQGSARLGTASGADALAAAEGGPRTVRAGETLWFRWIK